MNGGPEPRVTSFTDPNDVTVINVGIDQDALDRAADQLRRDQQIADAKAVKAAFELRVRGEADTAGDEWLYDHPLLVCKQCNTVVRPGWIAVKTPTAFWVCGGCYLETNWSAYRHGPQGAPGDVRWGNAASQAGAQQQRAQGDAQSDFDRLYREMFNRYGPGAKKTTFNFGQYDVPGAKRRPTPATPAIDPAAWVARVVDCVPLAEKRRVINALLKTYHPDVNPSTDASAITMELVAALARCK